MGAAGKMFGLVAGLGALLMAGSATADLKQRDGRVCYDMLVVGTVSSYGEFTSLDDLLGPPEDGSFYVGGRVEMKVRVDEMLEGVGLPPDITVRALVSSQYVTPVRMTFYLQREERGSYWAAEWLAISRDAPGSIRRSANPPPRCLA